MVNNTIISDDQNTSQILSQNSQTNDNLDDNKINNQDSSETLTAFQSAIVKSVENKPISPEIQQYLEFLIEKSKMPIYDEETKKQIVRELFIRLSKFLSLKMAEETTEDTLKTAIEMAKSNKSPEELNSFLASSIPDLDEKLGKALIDFRDFFLTAQDSFSQVQKAGNPR